MSDFKEIINRSMAIRAKYHALEDKNHGSKLAFLTDAGLVGRLTMAHEGRWTKSDSDVYSELAHKLAENIWWQIVLTERMGIDINVSMETFLANLERRLS